MFIIKKKQVNTINNEAHVNQVSESWKPSRENREVRRKLRIARKLHELEEEVQSASNQVMIFW